MDCSEIRDMLDAYAISATSTEEGDAVEAHVADCVRCWEDLTKAQRTAALLALSTPIEQAPAHLEARIMAEAQRDLAGIRHEPKVPLLQRMGLRWSTTAAGLGVASVAALVFAGLLQAQVNDLRDENDTLQDAMHEATLALERQDQQLESANETTGSLIRLVGDTSSVEMAPVTEDDTSQGSTVVYIWGKDHRSGVVACQDMPAAPGGSVYQIWFSAGGSRYAAGSFVPKDGNCLVPVEVPEGWREPTGVGISLEDPEAVLDQPQDGWLAYAYLPKGY